MGESSAVEADNGVLFKDIRFFERINLDFTLFLDLRVFNNLGFVELLDAPVFLALAFIARDRAAPDVLEGTAREGALEDDCVLATA